MSVLGQSSLNTITQNETAHESVDLKTEFYTREGLWRLVPNGDYVRQPQRMYSSVQNGAVNTHIVNNSAGMQISSQEPVKLTCFKYFLFDEVLSSNNLKKYKNLCVKCAKKKSNEISCKILFILFLLKKNIRIRIG